MSEPRIWDIGDPEPEDVRTVSSEWLGDEWNDTGEAHKTNNNTGWKFFLGSGNSYMDWDELARRYGPLTEVIADE